MALKGTVLTTSALESQHQIKQFLYCERDKLASLLAVSKPEQCDIFSGQKISSVMVNRLKLENESNFKHCKVIILEIGNIPSHHLKLEPSVNDSYDIITRRVFSGRDAISVRGENDDLLLEGKNFIKDIDADNNSEEESNDDNSNQEDSDAGNSGEESNDDSSNNEDSDADNSGEAFNNDNSNQEDSDANNSGEESNNNNSNQEDSDANNRGEESNDNNSNQEDSDADNSGEASNNNNNSNQEDSDANNNCEESNDSSNQEDSDADNSGEVSNDDNSNQEDSDAGNSGEESNDDSSNQEDSDAGNSGEESNNNNSNQDDSEDDDGLNNMVRWYISNTDQRSPNAREREKPKKLDKTKEKVEDKADKTIKTSGNETKPAATIVFFGPSGAGKSTIMGKLEKWYKDVNIKDAVDCARRIGHPDRYLALIMDTSRSERFLGRSEMLKMVYTPHYLYILTMIDSPGHEAYMHEMVKGLLQADEAYLVVPGVLDEFQENFNDDGPIKRYILLAKAAGLDSLSIMLSKVDDKVISDNVGLVESQLLRHLVSMEISSTEVVPISALYDRAIHSPLKCGPYPYLIGSLHKSCKRVLQYRSGNPLPKCLRFIVFDRSEGESLVIGKVMSGQFSLKDKLFLMPGHLVVKVSRICCDGKDIDTASVGDGLHVYFKGQDLDLANKYILCDRIHPISGVRKFKAGITILSHDGVLRAGQEALMVLQFCKKRVVIKRVISIGHQNQEYATEGKELEVEVGNTATVKIEVKNYEFVCVDSFCHHARFGQFVLLEATSHLVAKGRVTRKDLRKCHHAIHNSLS